MKSTMIERSWERYRRFILPAGTTQQQDHDARKAFYTGAAILFYLIMVELDPGEEPTDKDLANMAALQEEIDAFGAEIDLEHLTGGRA